MPPKKPESAPDTPDPTAAPVTFATLAKMVGVVVTVVSLTISGVWFAAAVKADVETVKANITALKLDVQERAQKRDKEVADIKARADQSERVMQDMGRKLDVAIAILERVEKRMGER